MGFDDALHSATLSEDGSYTAYSKEYNEHYHSTKDGALHESLYKHVIPAMDAKKMQDEVVILDICFGLGFNTLATIYHHQQNNFTSKLKIYSPELDKALVYSLKDFTYPKEFTTLEPIIKALVEKQVYEDENLYIEVFLGDAREYVKRFENFFDVVYQDAFSPSSNPILWTQEYFTDIAKSIKKDGVLTTYSTALKTRLALHYNEFFIYTNEGEKFRTSTIASLSPLSRYTKIDMLHKIACNPNVEALRD